MQTSKMVGVLQRFDGSTLIEYPNESHTIYINLPLLKASIQDVHAFNFQWSSSRMI